MKKIILLCISFFLVNVVYAFNVDIDKIDINARSNNLAVNLDASYKIDVSDFNRSIVNDEAATKLVKNMINIAVSNKDELTKKKEYTNYIYIDKDDGSKTLAGTIFRDTYFSELKKYNFSGGYLSDIKTASFGEDVLAFAYLKDTKVNDEMNDVVLTYWLKKVDGEYKVFYPWITVGSKLEDYFYKLSREEENGDIIGESYNSISLENDGTKYVEDSELREIFNSNKNKVVQIAGIVDNGINMYGSGFFINEGIIVTTWSLMQQFLTESNFIYVSDVNGDTYGIEGIVAAQTDYDVVVLKLDKKCGEPVSFDNSSSLKLDDKLFVINSRKNGGYSINYGTFISLNDGRLKNLFALSSGDVGSALFNKNGQVVGFNVSDQLNSELSFANSTDYLIDLQKILFKENYKDIKATSLDDFKEDYYLKYATEKEFNNIPKKKWKKISKIGNLEKNINLELIKASYYDGITSLRYAYGSSKSIASIYYVANYIEELEKDGYRLVSDDINQQSLENGDYKIVIKEDFNYLIIIIVEK